MNHFSRISAKIRSKAKPKSSAAKMLTWIKAIIKAYSPIVRRRLIISFQPKMLASGVAVRESTSHRIASRPVRCSISWIGLTVSPPLKKLNTISASGIQAPRWMTISSQVSLVQKFELFHMFFFPSGRAGSFLPASRPPFGLVILAQVHALVQVGHIGFIAIEHVGCPPADLADPPLGLL